MLHTVPRPPTCPSLALFPGSTPQLLSHSATGEWSLGTRLPLLKSRLILKWESLGLSRGMLEGLEMVTNVYQILCVLLCTNIKEFSWGNLGWTTERERLFYYIY